MTSCKGLVLFISTLFLPAAFRFVIQHDDNGYAVQLIINGVDLVTLLLEYRVITYSISDSPAETDDFRIHLLRLK